MGNPVKPWIGVVAAALLVVTSTGAVSAQTEVEPSDPEATEAGGPGAAELAICQMPELGEEAASGGPAIASIAGESTGLETGSTGSEGCMAPQKEMDDPLGGAPLMWYYANDFGADGDPDILSTSWVPSYLMEGKVVTEARSNDDIIVAGQRNKVLREGQGTLIGVELARSLQPGDGVHIGTDVNDDATKRAPSTVSSPDNAFANVREVMSYVLSDEGTSFAGASDLAKGFDYSARHPFAAWHDGAAVYFFVPDGALGLDFRVVAVAPPPAEALGPDLRFMAAVQPPDGGQGPDLRLMAAAQGRSMDVAGWGAAWLFSTNGLFGWWPWCADQLLIHEPLVLESVSLSFSKTIASFCFSASARDLEIIRAYTIREGDEFFGIADIQFTLREEGKNVRQAPPAGIFIWEERIYLIFPMGLKAYGFHAITDVKFKPTGDAEVDRVLGKAPPAIGRMTNPTVVDEMAGYLQDVPCLDGVSLPEMPWG